MAKETDLLQGTLNLLILRTLELGPLHGWGISKRISQVSEEALRVNQGSLYPALYRLEAEDWVRAEWGRSDEGRRVKVYELTPRGRKQLARDESGWRAFSRAVDLVLRST
jgi:transcriptional regulator